MATATLLAPVRKSVRTFTQPQLLAIVKAKLGELERAEKKGGAK